MKSRFLLILVLLALIEPCAAVADSKKTQVDGHHLENTTVGFHGFAVDVPINYQPYEPPPTLKNFKPQTHADLAWLTASSLDRDAGFKTTEIFPYQYRNRGFVVVVTTTAISIPPVKREKEHLRLLDMFMSWVVARSSDDFLRDTRKIGATHVGRVGTSKKGTVTAANFVLVPPSTILTFYAASPEAEKDDLLADLDAAVATLNIDKRPRH